jgi:hypothetical protein
MKKENVDINEIQQKETVQPWIMELLVFRRLLSSSNMARVAELNYWTIRTNEDTLEPTLGKLELKGAGGSWVGKHPRCFK